MGFSLSCFYFEEFSSFTEWVVSSQAVGGGILHYLNDFLFNRPQGDVWVFEMLKGFLVVSEVVSIPLAKEKTVYPCTCIKFLGITIDSQAMEYRLPEEKLEKIYCKRIAIFTGYAGFCI